MITAWGPLLIKINQYQIEMEAKRPTHNWNTLPDLELYSTTSHNSPTTPQRSGLSG